MTTCTCSAHSAQAVLARRLEDAEAAMKLTLTLCQHMWAGGEMEPIKSYLAKYEVEATEEEAKDGRPSV